MTKKRRSVYVLISALPIICAFVLVQALEPFPSGWLSPDNAHYWPNLLRAFSFLLGGVILGMIVYTMIRAVNAEATVTGGHPRRLLYRHVSIISAAHGLLLLTLMFYIRDRINQPLSPATPFALVGFVGTVYGLMLMLGYQNSRLRRFHAAKQVLGTIEPEAHSDHSRHLCIRVIGTTEPMALEKWLESFDTGELVRLTVEKVEEASSDTYIWGRTRQRLGSQARS